MSDGIFLRRCGTRCLKTIGGETEKTAKNGVPRNRKAGWRVISSCRSARRAPSCVDSAPAVLCRTFAGLSPCCSTQALSVTPKILPFLSPDVRKEFFGAPLGQARRCTREELRSPLLASAPQPHRLSDSSPSVTTIKMKSCLRRGSRRPCTWNRWQ